MNLQDISAGPADGAGGTSAQGQVSSIRFVNSVIGNLGAPLRDGLLEDEEDEEEGVPSEEDGPPLAQNAGAEDLVGSSGLSGLQEKVDGAQC